jgi:glycerophosphoryl diester phosphodiesterase
MAGQGSKSSASHSHSSTTPLLLGHRGARASRHVPENTLASYELCLQHGCDGFEFDVRLSGDGEAVVCHDPIVGKIKIADTDSDKLALPTLEQVLQQFSQLAFLDIELKVIGLERQTLAALTMRPPQKGYVVSSFVPEVLTAVHDLDPSIPLGYLCDTNGHLRGWREFSSEWVIPRYDLASQELIRQIQAGGRKAMLWTVNRGANMVEFASWNVDAIISDETELLVRSLR